MWVEHLAGGACLGAVSGVVQTEQWWVVGASEPRVSLAPALYQCGSLSPLELPSHHLENRCDTSTLPPPVNVRIRETKYMKTSTVNMKAE